MLADKSRVWNTTELVELYTLYEGKLMPRKSLTEKISQELEPDLLVLSGTGVANILVFKKQASKHMKLSVNDDDDIDTAL